jgi:hypothetical protein
MDDLLAALLEIILEVLAEAFLQLAGELLISLLVRASRGLSSAFLQLSPRFTAVYLALFGAATGALSVLIFPHPLFHHSHVNGVSLVISPVVTGLVMSQIGSVQRRRGRKSTPMESFWYGFVFALAMAAMRFVTVS